MKMKYYILLLCILFSHCKLPNKMEQSPFKIHAFRLKPGADLRKSIQAYINEHNIQAGYIITCVGSLTQTHLRYANQPGGTQLNGFFEIVSLVGTVSLRIFNSIGKKFLYYSIDGDFHLFCQFFTNIQSLKIQLNIA